MALMKCPECDHEVSSMAITCPFCGFPIEQNIINEERIAEQASSSYWLKRFENEKIDFGYDCVGIYKIDFKSRNEWSDTAKNDYFVVEMKRLRQYLENAYNCANNAVEQEKVKVIMKENIDDAYPKAVKLKEEKQKKQGGCYIATAVYGDYNAPQTMVLRKYRDEHLNKHILGRIFIRTYYLLSPPIANYLRDAKKINRIVRHLLDFFVRILINQ